MESFAILVVAARVCAEPQFKNCRPHFARMGIHYHRLYSDCSSMISLSSRSVQRLMAAVNRFSHQMAQVFLVLFQSPQMRDSWLDTRMIDASDRSATAAV